jgi:hypothetical protein
VGQLFRKIVDAVSNDRVMVSVHADDRLRERHLLIWQVASGIEDGKLLHEHPNAKLFPRIEVEQLLAEAMKMKAVWSCNS